MIHVRIVCGRRVVAERLGRACRSGGGVGGIVGDIASVVGYTGGVVGYTVHVVSSVKTDIASVVGYTLNVVGVAGVVGDIGRVVPPVCIGSNSVLFRVNVRERSRDGG